MTVLDVVILAVIAACAIYGARQGLIRELSHIVAFVLGIFLAAKLHGTAARLLLYRLGPNTASIAAFLGLLLLVLAAVYLAFSYLKSAADKLKLGPADHVAGAVVGALQGSLICALIILALINFSSALPRTYLQRSRVASFLLEGSAGVSGIIPESCVSKLKSLIKNEVGPVREELEKSTEEMQRHTVPLQKSPQSMLPQSGQINGEFKRIQESRPVQQAKRKPRSYKLVHVYVALCDNENQGIVRVPAQLGNGQDSRNNLYWGALYGVKTFFGRSPHWIALEKVIKPKDKAILRRCVFRSISSNPTVFVVADAYDGARMKEALCDFLDAAAGLSVTELNVLHSTEKPGCPGRPDMVCFVGHNGLMDVELPEYPKRISKGKPTCAVVLACKSHSYFTEPLRRAGCEPLVTTSGFMAPEAYTLDAIIRSWANGDSPSTTRKKAGSAYAKYQKISSKAGARLFLARSGD